MTKHILKYLSLLLIAILASVSVTYAATWTEPDSSMLPPGESGNRDTPINVGSLLQTKGGPLGLDTSPLYIRNNALIFTNSINDPEGRNVSIDKSLGVGDSYNIKLPKLKGSIGQALIVSNTSSGNDLDLIFGSPSAGVNAGNGALLFQQGVNPGSISGNSTYLQWLNNGNESYLKLGYFNSTISSKLFITNKNSTKNGLTIRDDAGKGGLLIHSSSTTGSAYPPLRIVDQNDSPNFTVDALGHIVNGSIPWNQVTHKPELCPLGEVSVGFDPGNNHTLKCSNSFNIKPGMATGSVLFIGLNGLLAENNANFFWDDINSQLKLYGSLDVVDNTLDESNPLFKTTGVIYFGGVPFMSNKFGTNLFIGKGTPYTSSSFAGNVVALGFNALSELGGGSESIAIGSWALSSSTRIKGAIAIGFSAGTVLNTSGSASANTVIIGNYSLQTATNSANTVAIGNESLRYHTVSSGNTAIGYKALSGDNSGTFNQNFNTAIGSLAGAMSTTSGSVFIGVQAGYSNIGTGNVFVGNDSGKASKDGSNNTYLGTNSGDANIGSSNVFLGYYSGYDISSSTSLFIVDNKARTTSSPSANNALLYGQFSDSSDPYLRVNGRLEIKAGIKISNYKALAIPSSSCVQTATGWKSIHFFGGILVCERVLPEAACKTDSLAACCTAMGYCN
ncbi:hypothetical protein COT94_00630 [Candidatus Falkowbacteria bacterium CG10_big_fil_rev_8_21_14_0_10_37_14]|uniref:Trimeric autotransporter adhesin YadA-like head domain-containing protein n=1 Tax=Candidatus Falkowbacteria bacterium CG10_big_fil_rev_8_21_14_0_10_37_14 TaxID=1974561 RepID=A0A2M6WUH9_9BACT|nr:hypothetical protein [Candidatus Falkowbacteria bacterium]PIT96453.1 MAG: hypothetical protein COT94_00630 [Candidatus Falkowbacteria bacterium CG10_big_fil_rev_8_21_14_0_10_37_14]